MYNIKKKMKNTQSLLNSNNKNTKDKIDEAMVSSQYLIASLTSPRRKKKESGILSCIASVVKMESFNISDDFVLRMSFLDIPKYIIFIVSKEENENGLKIWRQIYSEDSDLYFIYIHVSDFYTWDILQYVFQDYKKNEHLKNAQVIFMFKELSWPQITSYFREFNIEISGGSNTKKHMFSPNHLKLSQFLWCLFGSKVYESVGASFHGKKISKIFNFETKFIRKFFKAARTNRSFILKKDNQKKVDIIKEELNKLTSPKADGDLAIGPNNGEGGGDSGRHFAKETNNNLISTNNKNINNNKANSRNLHTTIQIKNKNKKWLLEAPNPISKGELQKHAPNQISQIKSEIQNSHFYNYLDTVKILIETSENKKETQLKLETSWIEIIKEKFENVDYFTQQYQGTILSNLIEANKTLNIWSDNKYLNKKFPHFNNELNKFEYIILTFALCLTYYDKINFNALAYKIGNDILYLIYKKRKIKKESLHSNFSTFKEKFNFDLKVIASLGDFFITILMLLPHDLFIRELSTDSYWKKEVSSLKLNKNFLEDIKQNIIVHTTALPMISPPRKWSDKSSGGYLTNEDKKESIITGSVHHGHNMINKENLYKTINTLNKIKFGINNKFLDYINTEGKYLLDQVKAENELHRMIILKVAETYRNIPFYLPTNADWRGRIYCQPFWITYQGGDLTTALLNFWKGESIKTKSQEMYLRIYGANSHNENNLSKNSLRERLKWVENNYEKIISLDKELILQAENPFIFTAFCLNMKDLAQNPKTIIYSPVFLDATCSGIQHLAALLKDVELGSNVNLIESFEDQKPYDIYSYLLEFINAEINKFGNENIEFASLAMVKLNRPIVKKNIMTKVYNVTKFGMFNQLKEILEKDKISENKSITYFKVPTINKSYIYLTNKELFKIAQIIDEQIFIRFPSLNNIYNYFINITQIMSKLNLPVQWVTPSGLELSQKYLKSKTTTIAVSLFSKTKKMVYREWIEKLDVKKQSLAIIPNIIHSLDASHLINLINQAQKEKFGPIITIHDCFGTLPSKMEELDFRVKKEFVLLYTQQNFLDTFHDRIIQNFKDNQIVLFENEKYVSINGTLYEIPQKPKLGNLDLENIKNAKYMIT